MSHLAFSEKTQNLTKFSIFHLWHNIMVHVSLLLFKKDQFMLEWYDKHDIFVFKACTITTGYREKFFRLHGCKFQV